MTSDEYANKMNHPVVQQLTILLRVYSEATISTFDASKLALLPNKRTEDGDEYPYIWHWCSAFLEEPQ